MPLQGFKREVSHKLEKDRSWREGKPTAGLDTTSHLNTEDNLDTKSHLNYGVTSQKALPNPGQTSTIKNQGVKRKLSDETSNTASVEKEGKNQSILAQNNFESKKTELANLIFATDEPDPSDSNNYFLKPFTGFGSVKALNNQETPVISISDDEDESFFNNGVSKLRKDRKSSKVSPKPGPNTSKGSKWKPDSNQPNISSFFSPSVETIKISEKSVLAEGIDDVLNQSRSSNSRWAQMFKKRKERREQKRSGDAAETIVVPDTPEKNPDSAGESIDWDDDIFPPSDGEDEQKSIFSRRRPLFDRSNNELMVGKDAKHGVSKDGATDKSGENATSPTELTVSFS